MKLIIPFLLLASMWVSGQTDTSFFSKPLTFDSTYHGTLLDIYGHYPARIYIGQGEGTNQFTPVIYTRSYDVAIIKACIEYWDYAHKIQTISVKKHKYTATAEIEFSRGLLDAEGVIFTLRKRKGKWVVIKTREIWGS